MDGKSKRKMEHYGHKRAAQNSQHKSSGTGASAKPVPISYPQLPEIHDEKIRSAVFTHPNFFQGHISTKVDSTYDRLEFIGDAYIELFATRLVCSQFPKMPAGRLSQQRELLVKNETLAEYALAYGFDKRIRLPKDTPAIEPKFNKEKDQHPSKKRKRDSNTTPTVITNQILLKDSKDRTKILGDIFEAYIAGIVLSPPSTAHPNPHTNQHQPADPISALSHPGTHTAETFLSQLWHRTKLSTQHPKETLDSADPSAKVHLAQRLVSRGIRLDYREEAPRDESQRSAGKTWFNIGVFLTGWGYENTRLGGGTGLSKTDAGLRAAAAALENEVTRKAHRMKVEFDGKIKEERELAEFGGRKGKKLKKREGKGKEERREKRDGGKIEAMSGENGQRGGVEMQRVEEKRKIEEVDGSEEGEISDEGASSDEEDSTESSESD